MSQWLYDVSENVASAVGAALLIAIVAKYLGWERLARVSWRKVAAAVSTYCIVLGVVYLIVAAITAARGNDEWSWSQYATVTALGTLLAVLYLARGGFRRPPWKPRKGP